MEGRKRDRNPGRFHVTFAPTPPPKASSGGAAGVSPPEQRPGGGEAPLSAPSSGAGSQLPPKKLRTFRLRQARSGEHGDCAPMEAPSTVPESMLQPPSSLEHAPGSVVGSAQPWAQMPPPPLPVFLQPAVQFSQVPCFLYTEDGLTASYDTKFNDLHPDSQKLVLQIEDRIKEYKSESQSLDECSRLYGSSGCDLNFELYANHINQELRGYSFIQKRGETAKELENVCRKMLSDTDLAVRSYAQLRNVFHHPSSAAASIVRGYTQAAEIISACSAANQPSTFPTPTTASGFYSGIAKKPSPFMLETVARFERCITECRQQIQELEQFLPPIRDSSSSNESSLQSIPRIMSNLHDFFIFVAAKVEKLHQHIEDMKIANMATVTSSLRLMA